MKTLKVGSKAFYDTLFNGLVPCKVVSIRDAAEFNPAIRFELTKGLISSRYCATVVITADTRDYRKGETLEDILAFNVVPVGAVVYRKLSTVIKPYNIEMVEESK